MGAKLDNGVVLKCGGLRNKIRTTIQQAFEEVLSESECLVRFRVRSDPGFVAVGDFREAAGLDLLGAAYLEPAAIGKDPASQVYRETLAGFLAVLAVSQRFAIRKHIVLVQGDCVGALTALRKGSFAPRPSRMWRFFSTRCS